MRTIKRTSWIEGAEFKRVGDAFVARGYIRPEPDVPGGNGAYAGNIADQYIADMIIDSAIKIISDAVNYPQR